jgi:hypothetical protein
MQSCLDLREINKLEVEMVNGRKAADRVKAKEGRLRA